MRYQKLFIVLVLMITHTTRSFAQVEASVPFRHYDTRQGMPSTQVQGIFEDSKGYIWAITDRGAARFDGYEFKTYTTSHGLSTNNVLLINEDHHGRIWFMCNNGDYCFLEDDSIRPYPGNEKIQKLLKDKLPGPFYFDDSDTLWVTTFSGIQLFKCFGDSVSEFLPSTQPQDKPTYYLRKVGEKLVTLQVGEITQDNKISTNDNISYLLNVAGECKLACSVQVEENRWAVAGPGGFVVFDEKANLQAYFESSPYVFSTLEHDRSGHLWLTNSNGAYRLRDYRNGPDDADAFFEGHFISAVLQDRHGNYWFGDRDNGLFFVPVLDMMLYSAGISGKQDKTISIKKNLEKIYYSDAAGQIYRIDQSTATPIPNTKAPSGVSLDFVVTARGNFVTGNKPILIKTNGAEVHLDDNSTVRKAIMLHDGRCAFALADGIAFLSTDEKWTKIDPAIFKERCNSLFEDERGTLWIGSNSGLFKYDGQSFQPIEEINRNKPRIADIMSWNGYIVCATKTSGLVFYKPGESIFLEEKNGLQSNMTDCVASHENTIWVGTASGVQQIDIHHIGTLDFTTTLINDAKGLPSNEVNDLLFDQGKLIIATNNGLCVVDPTLSSILASRTEMLIGLLEVNGKPRDTAFVQLQWNENSIRIHYRSLYFRTAEKTRYRYRLDGLFSNWIESTSLYADFPAMPAGDYTFFVSAMNEDGEWGEEESLHFIINPHYTQTWWFRLLMAIILVGIMVLTFFIIYRQKKQKLENRAKMSELRQQALNANMNPHFIFNALGSIQHFINTGKGQEANEYLSDFSKLIRMNLETNQHPMVSLQDELERLELYLRLEKLRFGQKMNYTIVIQDNLNIFDLSIPPMLLQPYVENALIHGILPLEDGGMVEISVKSLGEQYEVIILDNGVGLSKSKQEEGTKKQSLAMNMNAERLFILGEMTGQKFKIEVKDRLESTGIEQGTSVRILIPTDLNVTL